MQRDALLWEMRVLKNQVPGITNSTVATVDGMLVANDIDNVHAETLAAIAAAMLGLAQRTAQETHSGNFRETVTRCDSGYIAVYALGEAALLLVLADPGVNFARLNIESRAAIKRMGKILYEKKKEIT